ncbi:hypothetical protein ACFQ1S_35805 [Kibdelosporangium lantanae]|uniref:Uncharacterized protein n=1 Tax=Kibdelosporangium lantanae TaxID=1497396 RepID=A0ABW3MKF3_9PSEU
MNATLTSPTFAREDHPVGEITLFPVRRPADRVSALVGYRVHGLPNATVPVTRVDVLDFVAYDTDK